MTRMQKTLLTWLAIGGGAFALYYLAKHEIGQAANAVNPLNPNNVFNTSATDLYQTISGSQGSIGSDFYNLLNPGNPATSGTAMYFVYDQNGNLERDSSGNLLQTPYAPGTPQNPYPNPHG